MPHFSNQEPLHRPLSPDRDLDKPVVSLGRTRACLNKGGVVDVQQKVANGVVVTDTGAFRSFLDAKDFPAKISPAEIDNLYRESIAQGVIDHHVLDNFCAGRGIKMDRCATRMVVDFTTEVRKMLTEKNIKAVETHKNPDLDALASAYLVQSLLQHGQLPVLAPELAALVNRLDYGNFHVPAEQFAASLAGQIEGLLEVFDRQAQAALGTEVFGNPTMKDPQTKRLNATGVQRLTDITERYANYANAAIFEVFNAVNLAKLAHPELDISQNIILARPYLTSSVVKLLEEGTRYIQESQEKYNKLVDVAQKGLVKIQDKQGQEQSIPVMMVHSTEPLVFTNLNYARFPQSIAAVYRGPVSLNQPSSGDHYDIGISPDLAQDVDLGPLCVLLNKAEKVQRDQILNKAAALRTAEEERLVSEWQNQPARLGMSGAEQVLDKDPTVLVANGTLIAASRTSLLSSADFEQVLRDFGVSFN